MAAFGMDRENRELFPLNWTGRAHPDFFFLLERGCALSSLDPAPINLLICFLIACVCFLVPACLCTKVPRGSFTSLKPTCQPHCLLIQECNKMIGESDPSPFTHAPPILHPYTSQRLALRSRNPVSPDQKPYAHEDAILFELTRPRALHLPQNPAATIARGLAPCTSLRVRDHAVPAQRRHHQSMQDRLRKPVPTGTFGLGGHAPTGARLRW